MAGSELPKYRVVTDPEGLAEAYIDRFVKVASYLLAAAPKARLVTEGAFGLMFTALGTKMRHRIGASIRSVPDKGVIELTIVPPFPAYAIAVAGALAPIAVPAYIAKGKISIDAVLTTDIDVAVEVLKDALPRVPLIEPGDFGPSSGAGFIGDLCVTPSGLVAFVSDRRLPFVCVDHIYGHEEDSSEAPDVISLKDLSGFLVAHGILDLLAQESKT